MEKTNEKSKFLKGYRVFFTKIERLEEMCRMFPDRKDDYQKEIAETKSIIKLIEKRINEVDGGILSEILFQKYILGRSLETVSFEMNYSKRQIERLHLVALDKLRIF